MLYCIVTQCGQGQCADGEPPRGARQTVRVAAHHATTARGGHHVRVADRHAQCQHGRRNHGEQVHGPEERLPRPGQGSLPRTDPRWLSPFPSEETVEITDAGRRHGSAGN